MTVSYNLNIAFPVLKLFTVKTTKTQTKPDTGFYWLFVRRLLI